MSLSISELSLGMSGFLGSVLLRLLRCLIFWVIVSGRGKELCLHLPLGMSLLSADSIMLVRILLLI